MPSSYDDSKRMLHSVMIATSMYFASLMQQRLKKENENTWTLILLISILALWMKVEHIFWSHVEREHEPDKINSVVKQATFVIKQTLTFLVVRFIISIIDGMIDENYFVYDDIVFPFLIMIFLIFFVSIMNRLLTDLPTHKKEELMLSEKEDPKEELDNNRDDKINILQARLRIPRQHKFV